MLLQDESFTNGWKHGQRSQGHQGKNCCPTIAHDTCHFCVGL